MAHCPTESTNVVGPVPPVLTGTTPSVPTVASTPQTVAVVVGSAVAVGHAQLDVVDVAVVEDALGALVVAGMAAMRDGTMARPAAKMVEVYIM